MPPTDATPTPAPESSADPRRGVITGLGAVSPLGVGIPSFVRGLRTGAAGTRLLPFHSSLVKSSAAGVCHDFDPASVLSAADLKRLPRLVPMALAAAREALALAGLNPADVNTSRRIGLILGTGGGGIDFTLAQSDRHHAGEPISLWTITNATHGNLAGELSILLGLRGPSLCVSTGCASSSDAAGLALDQLRSSRPGTPDAWVVVGADAHVIEQTLHSMELLRVISPRPCATDAEAARAARPFDLDRDGFILGEGAWAIVLERPTFARERGARALASLHGYGATCDAFHRVRPDPDMTESVRAIDLALRDAQLRPADVSLVHYHGTGTRLNDELETRAMKAAFGPHASRLIGHSIKGQIGHPQGASGLAALVATCACAAGLDSAASGGFSPPTANLLTPDPACDLNYSALGPVPMHAPAWALINCLAFGAKNSALLAYVGG
ncbi:MAG: beta-ketoacyl synthase N-terminal-like domain-containing protein [Planctomycetota bacterium]|nr:beta-ketoacyl synthase N-terminal-like domain-containing protein [Planctomycetota bacterium]